MLAEAHLDRVGELVASDLHSGHASVYRSQPADQDRYTPLFFSRYTEGSRSWQRQADVFLGQRLQDLGL